MKEKISFYTKLIDRFSKAKVVVIGDFMVDRFIRGKVSRLSPEAPVPVVRVTDESLMPGGAGNVIMNLAALGADVRASGVLGRDADGEKLIELFRRTSVETGGLRRDASRRTTIKTRVIADHQQVVRFDQEDANEIPHALQDEMIRSIEGLVKNADAVILSDYGKGVITRRLLTETIRFAKKYKKPVCVDPKVEHFLYYKGVTCITPNTAEAMGGMHRAKLEPKDGILKLGREILAKLQSKSVLITRGEEGMSLFEKGKVTHIPAKAQEVFDVTGAGDTVISVLALCLASGADLESSARIANLAGGIVVGKLGTATVSPDELKRALPLL